MKKVMRTALYYPSRESMITMFEDCVVNDFNRRSINTLNRLIKNIIYWAPEYIPYLYKRSEKIRQQVSDFYTPTNRYVITWALRLANYIPPSTESGMYETLRSSITQKFPDEYIINSEVLLSFDEKVKKYKSKQLRYIPAIAEVMFKLKEYEYTDDLGKRYKIPKTHVINDEPDVENLFVCSEGGYISYKRKIVCLDKVEQMEQGQVPAYVLAYALKQGIIKDDIITNQNDLLDAYAIAGLQKQGLKNDSIKERFNSQRILNLEKLLSEEVVV